MNSRQSFRFTLMLEVVGLSRGYKAEFCLRLADVLFPLGSAM